MAPSCHAGARHLQTSPHKAALSFVTLGFSLKYTKILNILIILLKDHNAAIKNTIITKKNSSRSLLYVYSVAMPIWLMWNKFLMLEWIEYLLPFHHGCYSPYSQTHCRVTQKVKLLSKSGLPRSTLRYWLSNIFWHLLLKQCILEGLEQGRVLMEHFQVNHCHPTSLAFLIKLSAEHRISMHPMGMEGFPHSAMLL